MKPITIINTSGIYVGIAAAFMFVLASPSYAGSFAVIINSSNTYTADEASMKQTLKNIFLKRQSKWPGGEKTKPIDRDNASDEHKAFLKKVLGMSEPELAGHWLSTKQKTGETAPRVVKSSRIGMKLIGKRKGGFMVVSDVDTANLPDNVKVLLKF